MVYLRGWGFESRLLSPCCGGFPPGTPVSSSSESGNWMNGSMDGWMESVCSHPVLRPTDSWIALTYLNTSTSKMDWIWARVWSENQTQPLRRQTSRYTWDYNFNLQIEMQKTGKNKQTNIEMSFEEWQDRYTQRTHWTGHSAHAFRFITINVVMTHNYHFICLESSCLLIKVWSQISGCLCMLNPSNS